MLFPLRDHNPRTRFPAVTLLLIAANAVAFLFELSLDGRSQQLLALAGGAIPYEIVNWIDIPPRDLLPLPGSLRNGYSGSKGTGPGASRQIAK